MEPIPYYEEVPSYEDFLKNHLIPNRPALIGSKLTCRKSWVMPTNQEEEGPLFKPNYAYLREEFGSAKGQVAKCNKRHFTDQKRTAMSFEDFVDLWEADDGKESLYYLKDCHLARTFPDEKYYDVPDILKGKS